MQQSHSQITQKPTIAIPSFLKEAYLDQSPIVVIKAGRRTGKTYNFVIWIIQEMDSLPGEGGLWVDTAQGNIQKYIDRYFDIVGRLSALLIGTIAVDMIVNGIMGLIESANIIR